MYEVMDALQLNMDAFCSWLRAISNSDCASLLPYLTSINT